MIAAGPLGAVAKPPAQGLLSNDGSRSARIPPPPAPPPFGGQFTAGAGAARRDAGAADQYHIAATTGDLTAR
jgi:hypothetical protein